VAFKSLPRAVNAEYNSGATGLRRPCTLHTREQILADLVKWATDESGPPVYWLSGMAGTGKTTVAYSLCEILAERGMLGGSFFCSRTVEQTRDPKIILPTISHQLSARSKVFATALLKVIQEDDNIGNRSLRDQFDKLILLPMTSLPVHLKSDLIVYDGFDEAKKQDEISILISLFLKHSAKLRVKIFISSRYEELIKDPFERAGSDTYTTFLLHNIEEHIVEADIKQYMLEHLNEISEQIQEPRPHWISDERVSELVNCAGKLFVYAAVVCSYIGQGRIGEVKKRLDTVLRNMPGPIPGRKDRVYQYLDALYLQVLEAAADKVDADDIQSILHVVLAARQPLHINTIAALLGIHESDGYQVEIVVTSLRSVLTVPEDDLHSIPITIFHASFGDYLTDPKRSSKFLVNIKDGHQRLTHGSFKVMARELQFNIWNFPSSFLQNKELDSSFYDNCISYALAYACQFWGFHLKNCGDQNMGLASDIQMFLKEKLLFWLEVLSGLGILNSAANSLLSLKHQLPSMISSKVL
jgi:hypothetical protein